MFQNMGFWDWVIILGIVLIFFGGRLPDVARSLGKSISLFKKGLKEGEDELKKSIEDGGSSPDSQTKPPEPKV